MNWTSIYTAVAKSEATQTSTENRITEVMKGSPEMPRYGAGQSWEDEQPSWASCGGSYDDYGCWIAYVPGTDY